jgi:hypothetical protein
LTERHFYKTLGAARALEAPGGAERALVAQKGPWVIARGAGAQGGAERALVAQKGPWWRRKGPGGAERALEAQKGPWKLKLKEIDGTALLQDPGPWRRRKGPGGAERALEVPGVARALAAPAPAPAPLCGLRYFSAFRPFGLFNSKFVFLMAIWSFTANSYFYGHLVYFMVILV